MDTDDTQQPDSEPQKSHLFQPGDPRIWRGGPKHAGSKAAFRKAIKQALVEMSEEEIEVITGKGKAKKFRQDTRFQFLMETIWSKALGGDDWAIQFIAERVEGKVPNVLDIFAQQVDLTKLPDDKLRRISEGEDLLSVLTS